MPSNLQPGFQSLTALGYDVHFSATVEELSANLILTNILYLNMYFIQFFKEMENHLYTLDHQLGDLKGPRAPPPSMYPP